MNISNLNRHCSESILWNNVPKGFEKYFPGGKKTSNSNADNKKAESNQPKKETNQANDPFGGFKIPSNFGQKLGTGGGGGGQGQTGGKAEP